MTAFSPYSAYPSPESRLPYTAGPLPVLVAFAGPAPQKRLTVLVRLIMAIPHFIVLYFLVIAAEVVAFLGWWGALFMGRLPEWAYTFLGGTLRWFTRVQAYALLLTDVYPRFSLDDDERYPVRVAVPPIQRVNRFGVFFRLILMIPAVILLDILSFGAGTLMAFVAWLITLVSGQLPAAFHSAFSAVLRFQARFFGYALMLTDAYPGKLYGDVPGTPTWADGPSSGVPQGYGTPESAYGGGSQPGYGSQASYPGQAGYPSQPGYPASGYPAGYAAQPVLQPASWLLVLPDAGKRLLTAFIVLGVIFGAGYGAGVVRLASSEGARNNNIQTAQNALDQVNASYLTLASNLTGWENGVQACNGNLTCVTGQDAKAAGYFNAFDSRLSSLPVPPNSAADATRLGQVGAATAHDLTQLSKVTTGAQYQSVITSTGLQATLNDFDSAYNAFVRALESN